MAEFLVIRLSTDTDTADWIVVDEFGTPLVQPATGTLADALAEESGRKVIALAPSVTVLRVSVDLPLSSRARLQQALPYALEDLVSEDIELLHFASGRRAAGGTVPVAVIRREQLAAWHGRFTDAGVDLQGIYAESDALGDIPATTTLLIGEDTAILREDGGETTVIDLPSLEPVLELWLARRRAEAEGREVPAPVNLQVYCCGSHRDEFAALWDRLRAVVETLDIKVLPEGPLPRMARQIVASPGVNLLQGAFAPRSSFAAHWPAWRMAASLLVALCGLMAGASLLELRQLQHEQKRLDAAIEAAFRYSFPEIREIRDPARQLASILRARGQNADKESDIPFLDTLQAVALAVNGSSEATLDSLNFRAGLMELRVHAPDVDTLDKIKQQISSKSGLQTDIQSAIAAGEQIEGRIRIKPAAG